MILEALIGVPSPRAGSSVDLGGTWSGGPREVQTAANVPVSELRSLTLPAVFRAVDNLTSHIAMVKLPLLERRSDDGPDRLADDPRDWMMNGSANPEMGSFNARRVLMLHAILSGNGYAEPVRNGRGEWIEWWPIDDPSRVTPKRDDNGDLFYEIRQPNGRTMALRPPDILHVFNLTTNGVCGLGLIKMLARENIGLQLAIEKYAASYFGNGVNVGTIFNYPNALKPEEHRAHLEAIRREYATPENSGKPFLTHGGMKIERGPATNKDAMMIESMTWSVGDVARWMNVPPYKLFELSRATFSNIEQADIEYVKWSLAPWFKQIEQEFTRKLVDEKDRRRLYFEHGVDNILRGDTASRVAYYQVMSERGMSINAILRMENMKGIGPVGDLHLVQSNMTTLEALANGVEKKDDPDLDFKREIVKGLVADGTIGDVIFNLTNGRQLLQDVNIPTEPGSVEPWLPVVAEAGPLVNGDTMRDSEGDIVGGDVESESSPSEPTGNDGPPKNTGNDMPPDRSPDPDPITQPDEDRNQDAAEPFRGILEDAVARVQSKVRNERDRKNPKPWDAIYADQFPKARMTLMPVSRAIAAACGADDAAASSALDFLAGFVVNDVREPMADVDWLALHTKGMIQ